MWGMHWGWWIFWIVFLVIAVLLFRRRSENQPIPQSHETALEILKRRYANGEISTAEYEERKGHLENQP